MNRGNAAEGTTRRAVSYRPSGTAAASMPPPMAAAADADSSVRALPPHRSPPRVPTAHLNRRDCSALLPSGAARHRRNRRPCRARASNSAESCAPPPTLIAAAPPQSPPHAISAAAGSVPDPGSCQRSRRLRFRRARSVRPGRSRLPPDRHSRLPSRRAAAGATDAAQVLPKAAARSAEAAPRSLRNRREAPVNWRRPCCWER